MQRLGASPPDPVVSELRQPPGVTAFGAGGFRIDDKRYEGPVLILADQVLAWSGDLTPEAFADVVAADRAMVEFVLLGLGVEMRPPPRPLRDHMQAHALGLEVMTTVEAVRLYNVLAREGRRIALALVPV